MANLTQLQKNVLSVFERERAAGRACGAIAISKALHISRDSTNSCMKTLRKKGLISPRLPGSNIWCPTDKDTSQTNCPSGELLPAFNLKSPPEEVLSLRQKLSEARSTLAKYQESHGGVQEFMRDMVEYIKPLPSPEITYHKPVGNKVSTPIAMCVIASDWHLGGVQEPDEIENFNAFNPDILKQRINLLSRKLINWTEVHRGSYDVDEARVLVTGDMIEGDIHPELIASNAYPGPTQVVEAGRLLASMVSTLSPHFQSVVVDVICTDNHSRTTKKPQHKQGGYNSMSYPLAVICQEILKKHENVIVNIHPMEQKVVRVKNRRYLMLHGHQARSWMGVPWYGLTRKVGMEATKRMVANNEAFDTLVLGHFHQPFYSQSFIVGGSASGTDAFDHSCGRYSIPCQVSWMTHPRHGEFDFVSWRLDE